jgi:hypothetical protein
VIYLVQRALFSYLTQVAINKYLIILVLKSKIMSFS